MTEEKLDKIEEQIKAEQQSIGYDIKDLTIQYYVDKYLKDEERDENEIYVPDYQREFIWDIARQSKFIESIILGLPIPLIFVAEIEETGRLEIVDGSQRIRTLAAFIRDDLKLNRLDKLSELNGYKFSELKPARQRLINNTTMRMIVLSSKANEDIRNDMFGRINTSSVPLLPMETRRGIYRGKFMDFVTSLAENSQFQKLCPIDRHFKNRREEEELILRFFAFTDAYPDFNLNGVDLEHGSVSRFIDVYLDVQNQTQTDEQIKKKKTAFFEMLNFIEKTFEEKGFGKYKNSTATSRAYFEAIAVGGFLALRSGKRLNTTNLEWSFLDKNHPNELFRLLSGRYHTHKPNTLRNRIKYVMDNLTN